MGEVEDLQLKIAKLQREKQEAHDVILGLQKEKEENTRMRTIKIPKDIHDTSCLLTLTRLVWSGVHSLITPRSSARFKVLGNDVRPHQHRRQVLSAIEELPSEFLGSEKFLNEAKTSYFLHETLQKPTQRILNAYLRAIKCPKKLYFDKRTTQPDCLVLCADILTSAAELEAAAETEQAEQGVDCFADQGDDVAAEPASTVHHVHRISIAEHKAVHRLRAAAVARYARGTISEDFIGQLAQIARSATASAATTTTGTAAEPQDANAIAMVQEDAVRQAERGPPGQVFFARALTQAFHYMVASGLEYGYMATGETPSLLRVPKDDRTTLLYHTALFPLYTRLQLGADGQIAAESDTTLPPSPALTGANVDATQLAVSLLTALSLLAFESQPEPVRQRSINISQLTRFPNAPKTIAPQPTSRQSGRKRRNDDDDDGRGSDDGNDNDSAVGDMCSQKRYYKRQRACLLGLMRGSELDVKCPNLILHRQALQRDGTDLRTRPTAHAITATELHELVRLQLLANAEQDCHCFLEQGLSGAIGCLFKITITGYGYTFSAKGVEEHFSGRLRREVRVYDALAPQQGSSLPVCLGLVELLLPWPMANGALVTHMLLMSYAGRPLLTPA
ncbi:hypothetical protein CMQ_6899 [Grosmannia clavigera kw1407]|uniref:Uncharacterized protein n=1 Tax=Grosmannia clavigera (strain kw1407 / UAMH 11150) TaxID=655863 RepID=F0X6P3_GROCL|nr:uncharacterized protein CMQ_6899 [Grosmannia clavigera kw1407]EFX06578.1 hypothetical protein CMQ_6899 [Grosmannia clavigera kw1407]